MERKRNNHRASPSFHSMPSDETSPSVRHPVPTMQDAFEESIHDQATRQRLQQNSSNSPQYDSQPQNGKYHHLYKLVSQIAFGIHLLHGRLAKCDSEVVTILQSHVDDMDEFLFATTEDFDLAKNDISTRIKNLRVPLDAGAVSEVFDEMLQEREFRHQIIEGNEKVEYVITQTTLAMNEAMKDVTEGLKSVDELAKYLLSLKKGWKDSSLLRVYATMTHNAEGWIRGLVGLQQKATGLGEGLGQLKAVVREIEKRAGIASRKNRSTVNENKHLSAPIQISQKPLPATPVSSPLLTSVDIRPIPKTHHTVIEHTCSLPMYPTLPISPPLSSAPTSPEPATEKPPSISHSFSERLKRGFQSRSSWSPETAPTRGEKEKVQESQGWRRTSRIASTVRARPVLDMHPQPLSPNDMNIYEKDRTPSPHRTNARTRTNKHRKVLRRPRSCVIM